LLTPFAVGILALCHNSTTLNDFVNKALSIAGARADETTIRQTIAELARARLLVPLSQLLGPIEDLSIPKYEITSVVILTANRRSALKRALLSYFDNFRVHERCVQIVVMDDSRPPQEGLCDANLVSSIQGLRLAGQREKEQYVEELTRIGVDPETSRFAVLGKWRDGLCSIGANRNAALLDTIDEMILVADDDTECRFVSRPNPNNHLTFSSGGNPRETWFFEDRGQLLHEVQPDNGGCDILGQHERLLGRKISELIANGPWHGINVRDACVDMIRALETLTGKIVGTMPGIAGDSGMCSPISFLSAAGSTRERLARDERSYRTAFRSREILGLVPTFTAMFSRFCMGTSIGIDNSDTIPPFFPIGRNEDGVFGALVSLMKPTLLMGHIPVAVFHNPPTQRAYKMIPEFRISELIISLLLSLSSTRRRGSRELLRYFGMELTAISKLSHPDFWLLVSGAHTRQLQKHLRQLESSVRDSRCPGYWRIDLCERADQILSGTVQQDACVPAELKQMFPIELAKEETKRLVAEAGALFYSWPDLLEAASQLRKRGIRISRNVR